MSISKQYGPLKIEQADAQLAISIDGSVEVGGGSMKGVITAEGKGSVVVHELVLADAGLDILAQKFPVAAAGIAILKGLVDAELQKL